MESLYTKVVIKILTDRRNDCSLTETLKFLYFSPKIFNGQEKMEEFIKICFSTISDYPVLRTQRQMGPWGLAGQPS